MSEPNPDVAPRPKRRRRILRWCLRGVASVIFIFTIVLLAMAFPPGGRVLQLPEWSRARIEARIDRAMPAGEVTLGGVGMRLSRDRLLPQVIFTGIELSSNGHPRIVLPEFQISIDPRAALTGAIRPRHVRVSGAGLRLVMAEDGSLDLAFAGSAPGQARDLAETLAGIDRMFSQPVFSYLETVTADDADFVIEIAGTNDQIAVRGATLSLVPEGQALTLSASGTIEGTPDSALAVTITRRAHAGETELTAEFLNLRAGDIAAASDALAWLSLIDAPISGQMSSTIYDDASLGPLTGALQVGEGHIVPGGGVDPIPLESLTLSFDFDADAQRLQVQNLSVISPLLTAEITGYADLLEGPVYVSQFQLSNISSLVPGIFDDQISFTGGALDMRAQLFPYLQIDLGQVVLFDQGLHLTARGQVRVAEDGLHLRIDAEIPELEARRVLPLWPLISIPNTRNWLERNILAGTVRNIHAGLRLAPATDPQFALTLDFEDAHVRALQRMAPIEDGRGYLDLSDNAMTLALHQGHITAPNGDPLDLTGSVMRIDDTRVMQSNTTFDLQIAGSVPAALTLIGSEPLNLLEQFPFDPATVADGTVDLQAHLQMVLRREITPRDVTFTIGGTLAQVRSDQLVQGRVLQAAELRIDATNSHLEIGGPARLDSLQANASWSRALGPGSSPASRVEGTATLTPEALADFGVRLPDGMLRGRGFGDFSLELRPGDPPQLSLVSDLAGIGLAIPALGWRLPVAEIGQLTAEVILGPSPSVPLLAISGAGLDMRGSITLDADQGFSQLALDQFRIGNWIDVTGGLYAQGNGPPLIRVLSGEVDLRGLPQSSSGGGGDTLPMEISLDRLLVTQGVFLTNLRTDIGGSPISGEFQGQMGGQVQVNGTILTEPNGMAVRMQSRDGGAVLRAAGIYPNAHGGEMDLILRPNPGDGNYAGLLTIENPRLRNAPAIAELLNAISVIGLLEQMASGEGISLGDVRVDFRITPRGITIVEGTALGPSMGLSMEGIYDTQVDHFEFEGVVSPFYVVNGLFGAIFSPRREGLFGFTYRLTGSPDNSSVNVNPLSVLTPGIFREIFRSPPPETLQ